MTSPQSHDNSSIKQSALENVTAGRDINVTIHQAINSDRQVAIAATLNTTPPPVDEWQGRQDEIKELQTALTNEKVRLIGMTAAGGYFGCWLLEQLGRAYDEKWNEETLIGQIIKGLIAEPCLLVLDNMETVIPAEGNSVYGQF